MQNNNFKFHFIGHSMGGLVSRYYIENLGQSSHARKLITIDTPHWGSELSEIGQVLGWSADDELEPDSKLFWGNDNTGSSPFNYQNHGNAKYYAIAGLTFYEPSVNKENELITIPMNITNYWDLNQLIYSWDLVKNYANGSHPTDSWPNAVTLSDEVVNLLSQIGWSFLDYDLDKSPQRRINMDKILINVDSNGGNYLSSTEHFHGKNPHRLEVIGSIEGLLKE